MSRIDFPLAASELRHSGLLRTYREALARAVRRAAGERLVRCSVKELGELDDRMLKDIGLTRGDIESRIREGRRRLPLLLTKQD